MKTTGGAVLCALAITLAGCGGGGGGGDQQPSSPGAPEASPAVIIVSSSMVRLVTDSTQVQITVSAGPGLSQTASLSLEDVPAGVDATPVASTIGPGLLRTISIAATADSRPGDYRMTLRANASGVSEALPVNVSIVPKARSYREGSMLYLQRDEPGVLSRIGVDLRRGGMIAEASLNGINFVNAHDTGRGVQLALYDGAHSYDACAGCSGSWGWNPVQGGNHLDQGSTVLESRAEADTISVRTRAMQWMGADPSSGAPLASDVVFEQRVSPVDGDARAYRVDFRIESDVAASRQLALQELPAVYAGASYRRLVTYGGALPWTGAAASETIPLPLGQLPVRRYSAEYWFALVDADDLGVSVFAPGSDPYVSGFIATGSGGPSGFGAVFARLDTPLAVRAGKTIVGHYYLLVGDYKQARTTIYRLRAAGEAPDLSAPRMTLDSPAPGARANGEIEIRGWAVDNRRVAAVSVFVDGQPAGQAGLGGARPDVAAAIEGAPPDSGFHSVLDSRRWPNGKRVVKVIATDAAGNESEAQATVEVAN